MPYEDKFIKFTKLYILIFLLFLSIPIIFGLVLASLYQFSKLISSRPVDMFFELAVMVMPIAVFETAYIIFFRRTKHHPSKIVRGISYFLFVIALCYCTTVLVLDMYSFFTTKGHVVTDYNSFSLLCLAGNIALLFIVGLLQAFTTAKEKDWMDRRKVEN
jgi:hypothetical protein